MTDLQPDTHEVLQEEPYVMAVTGSMSVSGPVRTQALPRKGGATRSRLVGDGKPVQLLTADPRRARAVLLSLDKAVYVGYGQASATDASTMVAWPAGVPFECAATVDVFVQCAEQGQNTMISVATEMWAEG